MRTRYARVPVPAVARPGPWSWSPSVRRRRRPCELDAPLPSGIGFALSQLFCDWAWALTGDLEWWKSRSLFSGLPYSITAQLISSPTQSCLLPPASPRACILYQNFMERLQGGSMAVVAVGGAPAPPDPPFLPPLLFPYQLDDIWTWRRNANCN